MSAPVTPAAGPAPAVANKRPPATANTGESARRYGRRWPWLSWDDYGLLALLPEDMALLYRQHLRDEAVEEERYRDLTVGLEPDVVERIRGERQANWSHGAGGGRRKPALAPCD